MDIKALFDDKKTSYTITDEHQEKSTITLDKWAADLLQETLSDVHAWVQEKYDIVCEKKPLLSRREKGDVVRALARQEAEKNPNYPRFIDLL